MSLAQRLSFLANGITGISITTILTGYPLSQAENYHLLIAITRDFTRIFLDISNLNNTRYLATGLPENRLVYR